MEGTLPKIILYVEDNPDHMLLVQQALESRGYRVLKAIDGRSGLEIAERQEVDLILLDISLPDIDGYEVARRLRRSAKSSLRHTPIFAITAHTLAGDAQKAWDAGCDVYMPKPVNIRELLARVETFLPGDR
jgi:two-component system cell cycle response regulator DivK